MTSTSWCSEPQRHRAFGRHQRGLEGPYCTACEVVAAPIDVPSSGVTGEPEANMPSSTPDHDVPSTSTPRPDASSGPSSTPSHDIAPTTAAPSAGATAPTSPDESDWPAPGKRKGTRRTCPNCDRHFLTPNSKRIYCSDPCRKNASKRRQYIRMKAERHERYTPRMRRPVLTNIIGSDPYAIPRDEESDD